MQSNDDQHDHYFGGNHLDMSHHHHHAGNDSDSSDDESHSKRGKKKNSNMLPPVDKLAFVGDRTDRRLPKGHGITFLVSYLLFVVVVVDSALPSFVWSSSSLSLG